MVQRVVIDLMCAVQHQRRQPVHAAIACGHFHHRHEGRERELVDALRRVACRRCSGGRHPETRLADQRGAAFTGGPAVGEHRVEPELLQRRCGVPHERVLPDDQAGFEQQFTFGGDIDLEIRVAVVQRADSHRGHAARRFQQHAIGARARRMRVGVDQGDQDDSSAVGATSRQVRRARRTSTACPPAVTASSAVRTSRLQWR